MAASYQTYSVPRRLYRYRSVAGEDSTLIDREVSSILDKYIYCAKYSQMNDPMEGLLQPSKLFRDDDPLGTARAKQFHTQLDTIGIASFSETFDHEPMWAHYAGQFFGICVAYDLTRLMNSLDDDGVFVRLNYSEQAPSL